MIFEVKAHVLNIRYGIVGDDDDNKRHWGKIGMLEDKITERDGFKGQAVKEWRLDPDSNNQLAYSIDKTIDLPAELILHVELRKSGKEEVPFVLKVEQIA